MEPLPRRNSIVFPLWFFWFQRRKSKMMTKETKKAESISIISFVSEEKTSIISYLESDVGAFFFIFEYHFGARLWFEILLLRINQWESFTFPFVRSFFFCLLHIFFIRNRMCAYGQTHTCVLQNTIDHSLWWLIHLFFFISCAVRLCSFNIIYSHIYFLFLLLFRILKRNPRLKKLKVPAKKMYHAVGLFTHHSHEEWTILWKTREFLQMLSNLRSFIS